MAARAPRDRNRVDEMRFADAAALEGWLRTRQARVRAVSVGHGASAALAHPFVSDAAYLQTDEQGRTIIP
jgi:hypothetical protein